ncbi:MAG: helix-turn-helix domain-containing protein [Gammaproteobacteria bacterium]|nr:helix-turn-helix domain-containing protein [Gammaproteobacteria bacterium]
MNYNDKQDKLSLIDNLQKNLKYLIKKYNLDNESLAKCTGLASSTIASLRTRATNPTILTLQPLADFFNITIDQLISQDYTSQEQQNSNINNQAVINIPLININMVPEWPTGNVNILDYITTSGKINSRCFALRLDSEVLMPNYQKNTVLIIDPYKTAEDSNIVILSIENKQLTYRQVFIDGMVLYFKPVNTEFGSLEVISNYKIYGVVVRAIFDVCTESL